MVAYVVAVIEPVDEAGLGALDVMAVVWQFLLPCVLKYHLDVSYSALEMGAVISGQRGSRDLIGFGALVVRVP